MVARLEALVRETAADEIMVFPFTHGLDERLRSLELLAQAWQLGVAQLDAEELFESFDAL